MVPFLELAGQIYTETALTFEAPVCIDQCNLFTEIIFPPDYVYYESHACTTLIN